MPAAALAQSSSGSCRITAEKVEELDTRFLGLEFQLVAFSLAQKYCGAKPKPMRQHFLDHLEKNGCRRGTEVYSKTEELIDKLEPANLVQLAQGVAEETELSEQQAKEWAAATTEALGGCDALIKGHDG